MNKLRIRFRKESAARFISHLDLMRTFQRAFARAQIPIRHTEGFNPHPYISIAHPLSVGFEGENEILDFDSTSSIAPGSIPELLNANLPKGLTVLSCYPAKSDIKRIAYAEYSAHMRFIENVDEDAEKRLTAHFSSSPIMIMKRSKKGIIETDISKSIKSFTINERLGDSITATVVLRCINNSILNPVYLVRSLEKLKKPEVTSLVFIRKQFSGPNNEPFM